MNEAVALAEAPAVLELTEAQAKEYDFALILDASGSMSEPSAKMKGRTRWEEAEEFTENYARFVEKFDDDGLTVIVFSSTFKVEDGVKSDVVKKIFTTRQPSGSTNLAAALQAAVDKKFSSTKPMIVLVVTDGIPDNSDDVVDVIIAAANKIGKDEDLSFQFIQIGDDAKAGKYLQSLDDDLRGKGAKFDIVNTLTREKAEALTIPELLYQAIND